MAAVLVMAAALPDFAPAGVAGARANGGPTHSTVAYKSSVDRFQLSYIEWLPSAFNAKTSHRLVVYLHGMGSSSKWVNGGVGGDTMPSALSGAALDQGAIVLALNTRSDAGFYSDTPCGGPQEQDVLDALANEKSVHSISSVYLVGFSMGSIGALRIAADHPTLVAGVGTAGTISDVFEAYAFSSGISQLVDDFCRTLPTSTNATAVATLTALSAGRFSPTTFSSIPLYVTGGGADRAAPNNYSLWPYAQADAMMVTSSCDNVSALGEPTTCTTPIEVLHNASPSHYRFRYVFEPTAPHTPDQFNGKDLFSFLFGGSTPGVYFANYPPTKFVAV